MDYCIHNKMADGDWYNPPESWCSLDSEYPCGENCPYYYSKNDYEADAADRLYNED